MQSVQRQALHENAAIASKISGSHHPSDPLGMQRAYTIKPGPGKEASLVERQNGMMKRPKKGIARTMLEMLSKYPKYWLAFTGLVISSSIGGKYVFGHLLDRSLMPCRSALSRPSCALRQSRGCLPAGQRPTHIDRQLLGPHVVCAGLGRRCRVRCTRCSRNGLGRGVYPIVPSPMARPHGFSSVVYDPI